MFVLQLREPVELSLKTRRRRRSPAGPGSLPFWLASKGCTAQARDWM